MDAYPKTSLTFEDLSFAMLPMGLNHQLHLHGYLCGCLSSYLSCYLSKNFVPSPVQSRDEPAQPVSVTYQRKTPANRLCYRLQGTAQ